MDDFSGSGSSLIRQDDTGKWCGKIPKFVKANHKRLGNELVKNCTLHVHHHLASAKAHQQIESDLKKFKASHSGFSYTTSFSYVLDEDIVVNDSHEDVDMVELIRVHYDKDIEDEHTKKDIWFGYKQCGLPLILEHNTPNNSIALLWAASTDKGAPQMRALFARRKRHSSNG